MMRRLKFNLGTIYLGFTLKMEMTPSRFMVQALPISMAGLATTLSGLRAVSSDLRIIFYIRELRWSAAMELIRVRLRLIRTMTMT